MTSGFSARSNRQTPLRPRFVPEKPGSIVIDEQRSIAGVFVLKFVEGSHVRLGPEGLEADHKIILPLRHEVQRLARVGLAPEDVPEEVRRIRELLITYRDDHNFHIDYIFRPPGFAYSPDVKDVDQPFREKDELEQRAGEELADLDLYYVLFSDGFSNVEVQQEFMNLLNSFHVVEQVYTAAPAEGAHVPPTPDISGLQGYLDPAPAGLDARYAWTHPGGRGDDVRVIDVEYDWVTDHEDFPPASQMFWGGRPVGPYDRGASGHGTAVMGIVAAQDNGFGITGFAPNVQFGLASVFRPFDYLWASVVATFSGEDLIGRSHNVVIANTIHGASDQLRPGDVLLIEQHVLGPSTGQSCPPGGNCAQWEYVPMEFYQESFDVIRRTTARGVVVVQAAGNGTQDLDHAIYQQRFDRTTRDSRSLLVGASGPGDGAPNLSTNSAQRIDVHAWGSGVVTTGFGDGGSPPFDTARPINRLYRQAFSGTSSAAAIVAGVVACLQGTRRAAGLPALPQVQLARLLTSTGTPQHSGGATRPIGVQPNLRPAVDIAILSGGGFTGPGLYAIRSKWSGKVLDIDIAWFRGQDDGQALVQHESHGGHNQQFQVTAAGGGPFSLSPRHAQGKVLDVAHVSNADGAVLQQWSEVGGANQRFLIEAVGSGFYRIMATHSGKVLDVTAFGQENGTRIQQWTWLSGDNQLWEFIPIG